jgi:uncharacterized protein (TIGR03435 family)
MSAFAKLPPLACVAALAARGLLAQSESPLTFEVASIREHGPAVFRPLTAETGPGRFVRGNIKVKDLVEWAYDLAGYQIAGGPEWFNSQQLRSDRYDIEAKIGGSASPDQIRLMVQSLLADRFQLKVHREMRELPVYALVVARNGPKLKLAGELAPGEHGGYLIGGGFMQARKTSAADLAKGLTIMVDRPVLDRTSLAGDYEFKLQFDQSSTGRATATPGDPRQPSIFTAVQEQLGLRLEPQRAKVEILVIDSVERPSPN